MRAYETMYILQPDLDEEARKALVEKFNAVVTGQGATMEKVNEWGNRRLAYAINDFKQGYYVLLHYTGETDVPKELERVLHITDGVLRVLTTVRTA